MKKLILTLTIVVIISQTLLAQKTIVTGADTVSNRNNYIFGEVGGSSLGLTINYERFLSKNPGGLSLRAGIGFGVIPNIFGGDDLYYSTIPVGISYNFPVSANKRNFFELGADYTFLGGEVFGGTRFFSAVTGFRHTSVSGNTQIRITVIPTLIDVSDGEHTVRPFLGFSIGHRF